MEIEVLEEEEDKRGIKRPVQQYPKWAYVKISTYTQDKLTISSTAAHNFMVICFFLGFFGGS